MDEAPHDEEQPHGGAAEPAVESDPGAEADAEPGPATGKALLAMAAVAWSAWAFIKFAPGPAAGVPPAALANEVGVEDPAEAGPSGPAEPEPALAEDGAAEAAEEPPPEEEPDPEPITVDPAWSKGLTAPASVAYTVRHGGTLENVANLFKIYHHQIQALNPGVDLKKELPPGSKVVVYRQKEGRESASIGFPGQGRLEGAVPMPEGPGRILKMIPWKSWATPQTVAVMDGALKEWARRYPDADPVLVGNMSAPEGGKLKPHSSHQSGRDVDLGYMQKAGLEEEYNWREMTARNLDAARTWDLIRLLKETGAVEVIFIDRDIQKLLYDHGKKVQKLSDGQLSRWLEYPRSGGTRALVQHVKGHVDHMHVRIACPPGSAKCKTRGHS